MARVAIGVAIGIATYFLAQPVLLPQQPPPNIAGLYFGVNTPHYPPHPESSLAIAIRAEGCVNPVSVEGLFTRPARSWARDARELGSLEPGPNHGQKSPTEAEIVLSGASVTMIRAGLDGGEPLEGLFEASTISGRGLLSVEQGGEEFVENKLTTFNVPANRQDPLPGAALLKAPAWPSVKEPLHFFIKADLMHPDGFHRCYIDVPALVGSGGGVENGSFRRAFKFTIRATPEHPLAPHEVVEVPGFPDIDEISKAEVTVQVAGYTVDGRSIGSGATTVPSGVSYSCSSPKAKSIESAAESNATCAGTPVFERPGTESITTRQVFFAGIFGALAATLLLEALIGETAGEPRPQRQRQLETYWARRKP